MRDSKLFPPIKPDHAAAIGYVAAHWSMVEQQLAFIIYEMLHLHTILGWATTAELTTLRRINTISAFVNLTGEKAWIDAWADIAVTLDDLRNRRNDAVHSLWEPVGPGHFRMRIKAKGRLSIKQGPVTTPVLSALADEILDLLERLGEFTFTISAHDAWKIINQLSPPGWPTPLPAPSPSPKAQPRNPKRERQQRRREARRALEGKRDGDG